MATTTTPRVSPAHEAQKLFFEIGMEQRTKVGAALHRLGLSFPQAHALRLLDPEEPLPMSALAERLICDASNVTGIVDRLEARVLAHAVHAVDQLPGTALELELGVERELERNREAVVACDRPALLAAPLDQHFLGRELVAVHP